MSKRSLWMLVVSVSFAALGLAQCIADVIEDITVFNIVD